MRFWLKSRILYILVPLAVLLAIGSFLLARNVHNHDLLSQPDKAATLATADLLTTTRQLQQSLTTPLESASTTSTYLAHLGRLQHDCDDINHYKSTDRAPLDAGTVTRLNNSSQLCADLTTLAANSSTIFKAVAPLLAVDTRLKRYQSLPPIAFLTKQRQEQATSHALLQLRQSVKSIDFPTQSVTWLQELQQDMQVSHGLAYYPALHVFQEKMLAEQAQYWLDYGDLSSLVTTLQNQLGGYCQILQSNGAVPSVCQASS